MTVSQCPPFAVIDGLHIDREVFDTLARWASERGLGIQDAVQLALCAFNERNVTGEARPVVVRVHDSCAPCNLPLNYRRDPGTGGPASGRPSWRSAARGSERKPLPFPEP
jgi:hypothetical protein